MVAVARRSRRSCRSRKRSRELDTNNGKTAPSSIFPLVCPMHATVKPLLGIAFCSVALLSTCDAPAPTRQMATGVVLTDHSVENGLFQDLAAVPLTGQGLGRLDYIDDLLADAGGQTLLKYLVSCALPAEQTLVLGDVSFPGGAGLAPEWAEGPCEEPCQEWVSACLLARTNIYEIPVSIYLSGPHPALGDDDTERLAAGFDMEEGAYYGNLFLPFPRRYTCRGSGYDPLYQSVRVCAQRGGRCNMQWVGACGAMDGDARVASERHACEAAQADGGYLRCHNRASIAGSDSFPEPSRVYERVITVHLPHSSFEGGLDDSCGEPALDPEPPTSAGLAGARCENDDGCATELGLSCDRYAPRGLCTKECNSASSTLEASACGDPSSTCLTFLGAPAGYCTAACMTGVEGGSCGPGRACTGYAILTNSPDQPGCAGFCSFDDDCPLGHRCAHNGSCTPVPLDPELLADGEPCTFPPGSNVPVQFCRGICFRVTNDPAQGICGSIINLAAGAVCPDVPEMFPFANPQDDLGLCLNRACGSSSDCTSPLDCINGTCDYPP